MSCGTLVYCYGHVTKEYKPGSGARWLWGVLDVFVEYQYEGQDSVIIDKDDSPEK